MLYSERSRFDVQIEENALVQPRSVIELVRPQPLAAAESSFAHHAAYTITTGSIQPSAIKQIEDQNITMTDLSAFEEQHQPPVSAPTTTSAVLADSSPGPFEGPEKLLEIWFAPSPTQLPQVTHNLGTGLDYRPKKKQEDGEERDWQGLRKVKREVWEDMLKVVKCQVLSVIEGEELDAYLLR